jgi:LuxR family maltose regulon positive regulatory protein
MLTSVDNAVEARRSLDRIDDKTATPRLRLEMLRLKAMIGDRLGGDVDPELGQALEIAHAEGFVHSLLDASPQLRNLLVARLVRSPSDAFTERVLQAADRALVRASSIGSPPRPLLSERENNVLLYLPTRLTAREIAGELYISMNTLKTHLKHIYERLDVSSRGEAIERARNLGLLSKLSTSHGLRTGTGQ